MNEIWGPENPSIVWHWLIAVYLFLAGLSSGAMMTALSVEWMNPQKKAPWDAFVSAGVLIAPLTIILGLVLLIFDLTKPLNFYRLLITYNFSSVMSLGVLLLLFYTPLSVVYAVMSYRNALENSFLGGLMKAFSGILDWLEAHSLWFGRLVFALAAVWGFIQDSFFLRCKHSLFIIVLFCPFYFLQVVYLAELQLVSVWDCCFLKKKFHKILPNIF